MRHRAFLLALSLALIVLGTFPFEPYVYQRADFDPYYGHAELTYINALSRSRVEDYWRNVRNKAFHDSGGQIAWKLKYTDALIVPYDKFVSTTDLLEDSVEP